MDLLLGYDFGVVFLCWMRGAYCILEGCVEVG